MAISTYEGLKVRGEKEERVPEILTIEQIRDLLYKAKIFSHKWYPIWATALLTGMRNGELHALLWSDVDLEKRRIIVSKFFNTRTRSVKSTKSGSWRTIPGIDEKGATESLKILPLDEETEGVVVNLLDFKSRKNS